MQTIAIAAKKECSRYTHVFKRVVKFLEKKGKKVYLEKQIAACIGRKSFNEFVRGQTHADLVLVMGGDGTTLSVIRKMREFDSLFFGINMGTLGFLSEIPPVKITQTLNRVFKGEFKVDLRPMLYVEVFRGGKSVRQFHALNEAVISQGGLARLIELRTQVDRRKLATYHADGLIVSTPTGSTAYSLSAGGPIMHPSIQAFILTPIAPHSFTQKPIVIPDEKQVDVIVESGSQVTLSVDGQESFPLEREDRVHIRKNGVAKFVRLPTESFFNTLREKLHWGERVDQ